MSLEQVAPGVYERPFDSLEKFHASIAATGANFQREHYFIGSVIRLHTKPAISDLKQAWKALCHQHPRIAATTDETRTRFQYTVPTAEALEQWLEETFIVHPENEPSPSSAENLHRVLPPSPLFKLHWLPSSRELLFRATHWRTDGKGMMLLLDAYLSILSSSAEDVVFDGSEVSRIAPPLDELLCPNFEVTEDVQQASKAELSVVFNGPELASFERALPNIAPGDTYRISHQFSKDTTAQIIAASKKRGLKMTTAVQSALFVTAIRHSTPSDGRLLTLNAFNLRKHLPAPWNGSQGASGLYHTGRLFSVNLEDGKDFASISGILRSHYQEDIRNLFSFLPYNADMLRAMVSAPVEISNQAPGASHTDLSSFGVVDSSIQTCYTGSRYTLEIEDWWMGVHIVNKLLQTYLWTRDGKLQLACHYNEAFYEHDFVEQFLQEWKSVIVNELVGL